VPPISLGLGLGLSRTPRPFSPLDVSGCALWLRADLGVTAPGGFVSAWADQSGNARHFTQGTGANQPTYDQSGARPAVVAGGTRFMTGAGAASAWKFLHEPSSSVFIVTSTTLADSNDITALLATQDSGNARGVSLTLEDRTSLSANDRARFFVSNGSAAVIDSQTASNAVPALTRALVEYRYTPAAVLKSAVIVNGTIAVWTVALSAATPSGDPAGPARLGRFYTYTDGKPQNLYEVLAYSPALSVANAARVRRYLGARYGLSISETGE